MDIDTVCRALTGMGLADAVILDTETTGLHPEWGDELLSLAIVDADGRSLLHSLVRPRRHEAWPQAQRVNGISPAMVRDAPTADELNEVVSSLLSDEHVVVGFNLRFDLKFLLREGVITQSPRVTFDVMGEYARAHPRRVGRSPRGWTRLEEVARRRQPASGPSSGTRDTCVSFRPDGGGRDDPGTCSVAVATVRDVSGVPIGAMGRARGDVAMPLSPRIAAMTSAALGETWTTRGSLP